MRSIHLKLACLVACALAVSGCFESLTDIATPDKVVFYDDLVGDYAAVEPATGRLTLEKGKGKSYAYQQYDEKDTVTMHGTLWVVKLGEEHFYQISADGYATTDGKPMYAIGRLRVEGDRGAKALTGYTFKSPEAIFGDALVTTAECERRDGDETKTVRALSMPPEKLQAYLSLRAAEMTEPTLKFQQARSGR